MQHFFVSADLKKESSVEIIGDDAGHIINVLRKKKGDKIHIADNSGILAEAEIVHVDSKRLIAEKVQELASYSEPTMKIILLQSLPKKDKMDLIIQKGTELGVCGFIPVVTERTIVRLNENKALNRRERWRKVARESSKQSGRVMVPEVDEVKSFESAIEALDVDVIIFPWEEKTGNSLFKVLENSHVISKVAVCIGPEGGWTPDEVELGRKKGAEIVGLGPRILRTETAAIATVAMLLFYNGDLGG